MSDRVLKDKIKELKQEVEHLKLMNQVLSEENADLRRHIQKFESIKPEMDIGPKLKLKLRNK